MTPPATGLQRKVQFTRYPAYADNAQLLRRLVSPLNAYRIEAAMTDRATALRAQALDPARQRFVLYVPPGPPPPGGYALLVFVPPWKAARVPQAWLPILDRNHVIFVSAAHSGNDANVLERRDPLALVAAYNVALRYPVNPAHVYIGGFSGGARVALRVALGYPDVFHGALLDAGSDPIGTAQVPLPPAVLLHQFQSTRIVFVTGDRDAVRGAMAARTRTALQHWCVFNRDSITLPLTGHALANAGGFGAALHALARAVPRNPAQLAACRTRNQRALDTSLAKVRAALARGAYGQARKQLAATDARFGGLAAPQSVALWQQLDASSD